MTQLGAHCTDGFSPGRSPGPVPHFLGSIARWRLSRTEEMEQMRGTSEGQRLHHPRSDLKAIGRRTRELRGFDMSQAEFGKLLGISALK